MEKDDLRDVLDPYDKLIDITVCGETRQVPENNTILRCLQYLHTEAVSDSELCWNGECLDCQVWIKQGDKEKSVMACRTKAVAGMEILRISESIDLSE